MLLAYMDYWATGSTDLVAGKKKTLSVFMSHFYDSYTNDHITKTRPRDKHATEVKQKGRFLAAFLSNATQMMGPDLPSPVPISLHANTRLADADATGLLNCSAQVANGCSTRPGSGHHIVDWDPPPSGSMFKSSQHLSVNNAFCLRVRHTRYKLRLSLLVNCYVILVLY